MKTMIRIAAVGFLLALCATTLLAQGLQPMRVATIKASPSAFLNERVKIEGYVTQFVDAGSKSTAFFYLKDDWGGVIKVRTSKDTPSVGKRYAIEGPVGVDPRSRDLFISEEVRLELFKPVEPTVNIEQRDVISPPVVHAPAETATAQQTTTATQTSAVGAQQGTTATTATTATHGPGTTTDNTPKTNLWMYLLIGGAVVVVLALVIILMMRSRHEEVQTADYPIAASSHMEPPPPPEQVIEGKTIKLHAPPPNTVKLLPGWFEVLAGDDVVKQIRFYKLGGDRGAETTFGRASGRPYAHIQLKAPTVSSRQAKVSFDNATAKLTNFASVESNPTKVNGRELAVNESIDLSESDRVEMGEVSLLFHAAPTLTQSGNA